MISRSRLLPLIGMLVLLPGCEQDNTHRSSPAHFDYEHPDWQNQGFPDCGGKVQSPINIDTLATIKTTLPKLSVSYAPFNFSIVDNGHTVQVMNTGANWVTFNGTPFRLIQLHFHHPSEHAICGAKADMELHLVHQDTTTGNLLVLGILIKAGPVNNTIDQIWKNIPATRDRLVATTTPIDLNTLLPTDIRYFTYPGSLTTPPCTDGVTWIVFKQPITMSQAQIQRFAGLYKNDARPLQPLNNRSVLQGI